MLMEKLTSPGPPEVASSRLSPLPCGTSTKFPPDAWGCDPIIIGAVRLPLSASRVRVVAAIAGSAQVSKAKRKEGKRRANIFPRARLVKANVVWIISGSPVACCASDGELELICRSKANDVYKFFSLDTSVLSRIVDCSFAHSRVIYFSGVAQCHFGSAKGFSTGSE
jgi:hypothetical protein